MRILNQTAIRDHALTCSKQIKGGKFDRVSESFIDEIQMEVEALIRSFESRYPAKTHGDVDPQINFGFSTRQLFAKLQPILDRAIGRLIQRKVEQHPSVGATLIGK